jgi:hypothetical protein
MVRSAMNKNAVPQIKRPMKPDAKAFNLALKDFAKLHQNLTVKIKHPDVAKTNKIVFNEFIRRIGTFVSDNMINEVVENFREIYHRFNARPNGFINEELVNLKQGFLSIECLLHSEWWDKVMNYQYELAKQKKDIGAAVNHCQQALGHIATAVKSSASRPSDIYANIFAGKVAYALEHVPENTAENIVNFETLMRIYNEYDNIDVFSPFYQKAESMHMRIKNGLSPTSSRFNSKLDFVM